MYTHIPDRNQRKSSFEVKTGKFKRATFYRRFCGWKNNAYSLESVRKPRRKNISKGKYQNQTPK